MFLHTFTKASELESSQSKFGIYKTIEIYSIVFGYIYFNEVNFEGKESNYFRKVHLRSGQLQTL
jgi:hypothetical protein